jgi:hypothetical protein
MIFSTSCNLKYNIRGKAFPKKTSRDSLVQEAWARLNMLRQKHTGRDWVQILWTDNERWWNRKAIKGLELAKLLLNFLSKMASQAATWLWKPVKRTSLASSGHSLKIVSNRRPSWIHIREIPNSRNKQTSKILNKSWSNNSKSYFKTWISLLFRIIQTFRWTK